MRSLRVDSVLLARINLRAASLLVPRADRGSWSAEWFAELHYACSARPCAADGWMQTTGPVAFSLGAFHDAFWIRCNHLRGEALFQRASPIRRGLILAGFAAVASILCLWMPGARQALLPIHTFRANDLVTLSSEGYAGAQAPSIPVEDYLEWQTDTDHLFSDLAWYRPAVKNVELGHQRTARLSTGIASSNLFRVLGIPLRGVPSPPGSGPGLVLTRKAWRTRFQSDPGIIGRVASIDGQPVRIAAVIPDDGRLPGRMDAWLLDQHALERLPRHAKGFAFARIRSAAFPAPRGGIRVMVETRDGVTHSFECISVGWLAWQATSNFLFALLLACLALPATTALPLGDYPSHHGRRDGLALAVRARRWYFLGIKFVLVLAIVYPASIALAWGPSLAPSIALTIQVMAAFPALLFGFRWVLQDQRRRCPECLRLLSNPARVGQASCNFLSWNGTELFCDRGHGLLHIPELPTSWFSTQRWLCLDSSWLCLFSESSSTSPGMV